MKRVPIESRFWAKVDKTASCWLWTGATSRGYGSLADGNGSAIRAHRMSWVMANGPIPEGMHVLHRCDTPPCVNPDHLFLGTDATNVADRVAKGRSARLSGSAHPRARLSPRDVDGIRAAREDGASLAVIGRRFGVSKQHIARITSGASWSKVTPV